MSLHRLLAATPAGEDPVTLLQAAARDHIPVNPKSKCLSEVTSFEVKLTIPNPEQRPSIDEVIKEIQDQGSYTKQITHRRTFGAKETQQGMSSCASFVFLHRRPSQGTLTSRSPRLSKERCVIQGRSVHCICIRQPLSIRSRKGAMSSCRPVLLLERVLYTRYLIVNVLGAFPAS
jgi:hypothetical protein